MQDACVGMSVSGASRATCARSLYAGLLSKIVQDLSFRISAPRSCSRTTCARSLYEDLLRKMSVSVGMSVSGASRAACARISSAESCRSTCARSVYEDLLCKMSVSRSPQQDYLCKISVCGSLARISVSRPLHQDLV